MSLTKIEKQILLQKHKEFLETEYKKNRMSGKKTERQQFFQELKTKRPDIANAVCEDIKFRKKLPRWTGIKAY